MPAPAAVNPDINNILNPPDLTLGQLVLHADPVVQIALALLVILSIWSWAIMVDKFIEITRARRAVRRLEAEVRDGQAPEKIAVDDKHPCADVVRAGVSEWRAPPPVKESLGEERERVERSMRNELAYEVRRMEKRLPFLATVGSAAPFIGLFGTVWGIMNSFTAIAQSHDTSLAVVAPGIAQALIGTAFGLAAAIPAVMAYNKFATEIGRYTGRLQTLISTVGGQLVKQARTEGR
ncbi:MAG TPA: MotA/TolQ/ExbB proton channel family protein [Gammaproteobacteria bacterium]|jgi:biopolymer transport protein TolQ|nr:MotA/TolQ/ExbB proton channel family protein [Gammaproteobacteria bacterium]